MKVQGKVQDMLLISDALFRGRFRRRGQRRMTDSQEHRAVHRARRKEPSYARSTRPGLAAARDAGSPP